MSEYNAVSQFFRSHPYVKHFLVSLVIWVSLIAISAMINNNIATIYERESSFWFHFSYLLPWYIPWIILTPIVIYLVEWMYSRGISKVKLIFYQVLMALIFFSVTATTSSFLIFLYSGQLYGKTNFLEGLEMVIRASRWQYEIIVYISIVLIGFIVCYVRKIRARDLQNAELRSQLYKAELDALRGQLNPHFLFNALNTISGLTRIGDGSKATKALSELSFMLRSVLESPNRQLTTLRNEIKFVEKYLHFQHLRFTDRLQYKIDVSEHCPDISVPFLLLHTLVENAVKHGSNVHESTNEICISAQLEGDRVHIQLRNSTCSQCNNEGFGIGIVNCQKRLCYIYEDDFTLQASQNDDGYTTDLRLPIRFADAQSTDS